MSGAAAGIAICARRLARLQRRLERLEAKGKRPRQQERLRRRIARLESKLGADDPLSAFSSGASIATDMTGALESGTRLFRRNPKAQMALVDLQAVAKATGESLAQVSKDNAWLSSLVGSIPAGAATVQPWLIVLGSGAAAVLTAVVIAKQVKKRKADRAKVLDMAIKNGVPDAEEFASFTYSVARMGPDQLASLEKRLMKKLNRRESERARERISAKLRIVTAFALISKAEQKGMTEADTMGYAGGVDLVAVMGEALAARGFEL